MKNSSDAKKEQTFTYYQNEALGQIRATLINNMPWFIGKDVALSLGYKKAPEALRHLDDDEKGVSILYTLGGPQEVSIINESGLYSLILRSRRPEAKLFKKWITSEVLPAIRKTGCYKTPQHISIRDAKEAYRLFKLQLHVAKEIYDYKQAIIATNEAVKKETGFDVLDRLDATHLLHKRSTINTKVKKINENLTITKQKFISDPNQIQILNRKTPGTGQSSIL